MRESAEGALVHTIFAAPGSRTLTADGPAPVHIDLVAHPATIAGLRARRAPLAAGQSMVTGDELNFHLLRVGVVFGQAGRVVTGSDGAVLSFTGMSTVDTAALCAALAP